MLRLRRRGLAAINSEVRDGIVPATGGIALVRDTVSSLRAAPARNFRSIALIVACALFMEQLDATVLATALPTMAFDFGVPAPAMSIALTSYLLALALFIPISGRMADRFGSRTMFQLAILLFVVGSFLCAQARELEFMVFARFVQGMGGAMMIPIGRLVLLRNVDKRDMVSALSWMIMPALIGPIAGPPLGGFIVTYFNWRWIFYLNIPVGVLGFTLVSLFIPEVRAPTPMRADLPGFFLSGLSLGPLLFGLELLSRQEGDALALIALGLISGVAYIAYARRRPHAVLDISLLRIPSFRVALAGGSLTRITQGAQPFLLPLMLQLGFGMTAAMSGSITLAGALGSMAMKGVAPRVLRRYGFRQSLIVNGVLSCAAYAICAFFRPDWPIAAMFAVLMFCGFSMSFQFTAYNSIAYDEITKERMSDATSFYSTFQQLFLSLGICTGAMALHLAMLRDGRSEPVPADFTIAFLTITLISSTAILWNRKFAADAGSEMSGHVSAGRDIDDEASTH